MKLFSFCTTFGLFVTPLVLAVSQNITFIGQEIAQISPCGLHCLEWTVPAAGCSYTNYTCQCASAQLLQITSSCLLANCTLNETLALDKIQNAICQRPYQSRNRMIRITTIVCAVFTNTAALLRFVTRFVLQRTVGLDDLFVAGAVISEGFFTYFGVQLENDGFGKHVWDISLDSIPQLFYWFYVCELLYVITIGLIKVSLLFFYLRVFPARPFRIACWGTMAFCAATGITFALVTIFQCHPINYVWNKNIDGKCVNFNSVAWANAAINIFQDIIIILLPMNELRQLKLSNRKKIGMYAMFGVGGFVCITSMIRLESLKSFGLTADPTWDNIPTTFWSTLETSTAIFCSCMPAIRAGILQLFPRILGTTATRADSTYPNAPSKFAEEELAPYRPVEGKHERTTSISRLPTPVNTKARQSYANPGYKMIKIGDIKEQHETNHDVAPIRRITTVTEYLQQVQRDKPLPLLPASNTDHSLSNPPTSAGGGEETGEIGDLVDNSSTTRQHSKSFV